MKDETRLLLEREWNPNDLPFMILEVLKIEHHSKFGQFEPDELIFYTPRGDEFTVHPGEEEVIAGIELFSFVNLLGVGCSFNVFVTYGDKYTLDKYPGRSVAASVVLGNYESKFDQEDVVMRWNPSNFDHSLPYNFVMKVYSKIDEMLNKRDDDNEDDDSPSVDPPTPPGSRIPVPVADSVISGKLTIRRAVESLVEEK